MPWLEKTALVVCDLVDEQTGRPIEVSPRRILRRQVQRAAEAGLTIMIGSELEFYLFADSYGTVQQKGFRDLQPGSRYLIDYDIMATTADEFVIREIRNAMQGAGIPVEFSKGEWGTGQHEINLRYADALTMADRHAIYKNAAKEIANQKDVAITFMAKIATDQAGSSMHVHTSAWDTDRQRNLFWDEAAGGGTETFRHFLGGQLALSRELCYFWAPTVNSYKRFQTSSWAPTRICFGMDNRTVGYRVIGHGPGFRIENRMPGADANPYLAFAATIAAGLYGLEHRVDPGEPFAGNAYEAADLPQLPATLTDAIAALESSRPARDAFGREVVDHYVHTARLEQAACNEAVTEWELRRLFERI